ncbi:MAG: sulfurtransferase-like selenium metabolism protein YedF [Proteobacteria bacterium]|nr:sulfurtransferase-like selenium metabolism protein YedF [Desulfobacula sp.]MBU3953098.1 sulfurtransferase-like selenium metabolism protein YedF [Pseudomonadota bacterium]MBU4132924.1 sulfurtransferase-like selenium metabolism protein YedF [Pseudomonadota bacterium]
MIKELDCRKLDCPAPVLQTKKLLENEALSHVRILVDNDAAVENLSRFLSFHGFEVSVDSDGISSAVEGIKDTADAKKAEPAPAPERTQVQSQKIMVLISGAQLGRGDDDLGGKLMVNFIKTLKELGKELWRLVFVNHGVKLSTMDSPVLEELLALEADHIDILVCGACLTHLGLMEKKKVGQTTNMLDIVTSMQYADKVINL